VKRRNHGIESRGFPPSNHCQLCLLHPHQMFSVSPAVEERGRFG
jgi:hypothetical protein